MSFKLIKHTGIVGSMTLISRILGFIRDMVAAQIFGANISYDAFIIAFKIPNFMRRLFAEGAFSQAFVPVLAEYKSQHEHKLVQQLVNRVFGVLLLVLCLVTLCGMAGSSIFISIFAPGFINDPERFYLATSMLRITFPYILFISLTAFAGGILNTYQRFAVPAFTPVFLNIALIVAAVVCSPWFDKPIVALSWGVFIGGMLQLGFQIPSLHRLGLLPKPEFNFRDSGVIRIMRLMLPALFGSSVAQINLMIDSIFASFLMVGSVSWLYYSDRLLEFPIGIFGVALATVVLPTLSEKYAKGAHDSFSATVDWALRWTLVGGIPATIGLLMLAAPILTTLFQYGAFTPHDVAMASNSLLAFTVGLLAFIAVKILASAFYSRQNIKFPVKVAAMAMAINVGCNFLLVGRYGHVGLALATALAAIFNALILGWGLIREGAYRPEPAWGKFIIRLTIASAAMAVLLWRCSPPFAEWVAMSASSRFLVLAGLIGSAALLYGVCLWITGLRVGHLALQRE